MHSDRERTLTIIAIVRLVLLLLSKHSSWLHNVNSKNNINIKASGGESMQHMIFDVLDACTAKTKIFWEKERVEGKRDFLEN